LDPIAAFKAAFREKDNFGKGTPFRKACINALDDVVLILLNLITEDTKNFLDESDFCGNPFHCGLSHKAVLRLVERIPFAKELIQRQTTIGSTALHIAVVDACNDRREGRLIATSFIARELIDIDQLDRDHRTALCYAVQHNHFSTVELLLRFGCRTDGFDQDGFSALKIAMRRNSFYFSETNFQIVELLLAFGVDLRKESYLYSDEEMPECFHGQDEASRLNRDTTKLIAERLEVLRQLRRSCAMESLQRLCRTNIRRHLKHKADRVISSLTCIPNKMKTFLLVKDEPRVLNLYS